MGIYRHIFLTGEKQVGKSTLWKTVMEQAGIAPLGFQTLPFKVEGHFAGYRLHSLGPVPGEFHNDIPISVHIKPKIHLGITESFDLFGTALLEQAATAGSFLLMDELGRFEKNAHRFQQAVFNCLDSSCHVLGVLHMTDSAFLNRIQEREDVLVFTVTKENRDRLDLEILGAVRKLQQTASTQTVR